MQKLLREYLDDLNRKRKKSRKAAVAALLLVVMVVGSVAGILAQYGVAMTGTEKCGMEEHTHSAECYTKTLSCGLEESEGHTHTEECLFPTELVCELEENEEHTHTEGCYARPEGFACGLEEGEGHIHTDACYTEELTCGKEEHIHTDICYIDPEADVEGQEVWDRQYGNVEWKGVWGEDLVTAAAMQIGYQESLNNYTVAEDGSHRGYTRYGQFAGDVYGDWDTAFVNFCLHYAGLRASGLFPETTDAAGWREAFRNAGEANEAYLAEAGYVPKTGDLIFLQAEGKDRMGIVASYIEAESAIHVIEGNSQNEVRENVYNVNDSQITGFLKITELEETYKGTAGEQGETEAETGEMETETADRQIFTTDGESEADENQEETEAVPTRTMSAEGEDYTVTVSFTEEAEIPEEAVLEVREIEKDSEEYQEYYAQSLEAMGVEELTFARYFDVTFRMPAGENGEEGEEIEPAAPVDVKISYADTVELAETESGNAVHFAENKEDGTKTPEVLEAGFDAEEKSFSFTQNSFSVTGTVETPVLDEMTVGTVQTKGTPGEENGEIPADVMEELENSPSYVASYEDDMGTIHVAAGKGAVPEGAELSVKKIEPVMETADLDEEEAVRAQEINDQYELTAKKLSEESEKNNTTLEGFLAYDICFLVDGVEVEPNGPVKVTMDFHEAVKPEGVSENAVVAVNHLKEDETAEDGVVLEDLTEKKATTITTVEEEPTVEKVELVTESFSVFAVSWTIVGELWEAGKINVFHMDEDGNFLLDPVSNGYPEGNEVESGKQYVLEDQLKLEHITKTTPLEETKSITYVPKEIRLCYGDPNNVQPTSNGGWEVTIIEDKGVVKTVEVNSMSDIRFYSDAGEMFGPYSGMDLSNSYFLKVVYKQGKQLTLSVKDEKIKETGRLVPDMKEDQSVVDEAIREGKTVKYVWSKSVNGGEYVAVSQSLYANGQYNVGDNGEWLNVALDGGALNDKQSSVQYQVELWIDNEKVAASAPCPIKYYNEVRNGSFEMPKVNPGAYEQPDVDGVEGWRTTSKNKEGHYGIEIARVDEKGAINGLYGTYEPSFGAAAEGKQFAELNCETVGSLYQDILVERGTLLHYSFAHRSRANSSSLGQDTMYLLIVPTFIAEKGIVHDCVCEKSHTLPDGVIDTQEEVDCLLSYLEKSGDSSLYPGVYKEKCVANTQSWTLHQGDYMPIYNLNRFFFVSAEKDPTQGNFLDNVHFSQYLPKPQIGTFSFRINKTIVGLESEEEVNALKKQLTFKIEIKNKSGEEVKIKEIPSTLSANDPEYMTWEQSAYDGSWIGIATFDNIQIGENEEYTISVTEENATIASYNLDTSIAITGSKEETASEDAASTKGPTGSVVVQKDISRGLRFTNTYSKVVVEDPYTWKVLKCSSSDNNLMLPGATFELKAADGALMATGTSAEESGVVAWIQEEGVDLTKLSGNYTLTETGAPTGYVISAESWNLVFKENGELDVESSSQPEGMKNLVSIVPNGKEYTILIKNDVLYTLPSTGGVGTTWYLIGGTLLMLAAALILYKNKAGRCWGVKR